MSTRSAHARIPFALGALGAGLTLFSVWAGFILPTQSDDTWVSIVSVEAWALIVVLVMATPIAIHRAARMPYAAGPIFALTLATSFAIDGALSLYFLVLAPPLDEVFGPLPLVLVLGLVISGPAKVLLVEGVVYLMSHGAPRKS